MKCSGLTVSFFSQGKRIKALEDLSFSTRRGEFLCIVGPSGAGKTTLLRAIAGLIPIDAGSISPDQPGRALLVRQEASVFPWLTVLDNATFGLEMQGMPEDERRCRALPYLERFGLLGRENDYPRQLSVGMKQRVAVIQAMLADPAVLLMDEPLAGLDCQTRWQVQSELLDLWEQVSHRTVILVTHDVDEAMMMSDRILVLSRQPGRVVAEIPVSLPRPRGLGVLLTPEALALKRRILAHLGFAVEELSNAFRVGC